MHLSSAEDAQALRAAFGVEADLLPPPSLNAADVASGHLLARTLAFDPALLEESEGLLVKFALGTGVRTALEAFVLVGSGLLHNHQTTRCASPVGYKSATPR